jgi:DNA polymerase elongation subunit (family B)
MSRRVLTIDIETAPHLCYSFNVWNTNISPVHIVEPSRMISFASKWEGSRKVEFWSEFAFEETDHPREWHHRKMVERAWRLLNEADVVVTYNGDRFDLRRLGQEFRIAGLGQPSPFASVDLYKIIKREEDWLSHKLAYITERYKLTGKLEQGVDFSLWRGCMEGDPKSWRLMRRYNMRDVVTTEEVFHEVSDLPMLLPALALYDDEPILEGHCPVCREQGQSRGYAYTKTRRYPRYYCPTDKKWFRGSKSDRTAGIA